MTPTEEQERLRYLRLKAKAAQAMPSNETPASVRPATPAVDWLTALGRGAAQGATLGFGDELGGVVQALGERYLPESLGGGSKRSLADLYRSNRDAFRRENVSAEQQHGGYYLGGNVLGGFAPGMFLPVLHAAKGAPLALRALSGLASGIPAGALYGAGASNADLTSGEAQDARRFAFDTALGGGLGGAGGALLPVAGAVLSPVVPKAQGLMRSIGLAAGRRALTNGADSLSTRNALNPAAVEEAIRQGAIRFGGTTEGAHLRLQDLVNAKGAAHGDLVRQLEQAGVEGANVRGIADVLQEKASQLAVENPLNPALAREYESAANRIMDSVGRADELGQAASAARLPITQAEAVKRGAQELARYGRFEETPLNEVRRDIASVLQQANEQAVAQQAEKAPGLAAEFVPSKRTLGNLLEAEAAAKRGAARGAQRSHFGLYDILAGLAGFGHGNAGMGGLMTGAGAAAAMHLGRTRGPSSAAALLYGLGSLRRPSLAALARLRPQVGASLAGEEFLGPRLALDPAMADRGPTDTDPALARALAFRGAP